MLGRGLVLVAMCMMAQPAEARPKAKRVHPFKPVLWTASPAITASRPLDGTRDWRLQPVVYPKSDAPPMEWRFTGSKVKMRLAF